MDPLEEQQQELEVLESIYPDELTKESDAKFSIRIKLDTPSERVHVLVLGVKYPPEYPEVIPELDIELGADDDESDDDYDDESDDDDADTRAAKQALNMSETIEFGRDQFKLLLGKLQEEAEMQLGIPMVFALASQLKEEAETLFQQILDAKQKDYDRQLLAREQEEQKKFNGTPVTKESFSTWRNQFRQEINLEARLAERFAAMHQGKLTGREIFEKGLAGDEDDVDDVVEGVKKVVV
ncbi:RWD-domain-containing protein [Suhomyces tanzawaensis NRRL Y-17324]|uniref:RWD-domain-containing protein n=1 Tax=Suhomyces tanzawaensis NRRL Y-17324 TaxID=984487 RepID=A0A1E4SJQ6_9ASCO|nr:RWD-domain-containing protein [Suhomyces tanzawaensis NRRL Y-17324]ODV79728.1 RWD-domain-containing protein [Suhomyces tanzawaensis NRRL Y-17324]